MLTPPTLESIDKYKTSPTRWNNIPWGTKSWREATLNNRILYQVFDIQIPEGVAPVGGWPIMFYFHANGMSRFIKVGSFLDQTLVQPCLKAGIAVACVEFRHPVVNKAVMGSTYLEAYNDPGKAIQVIKSYHKALNLNLNKTGIVARSRGSLALYANLLPDLQNLNAATYAGTLSSKVGAAWINKGQSIHRSETAADLFVVDEDRDEFLSAIPNDPKLLNQTELVNSPYAILPKLHLVSEYPYYVDKQPAVIVLDNPLHYPDMMRVLAEAYINENNLNVSDATSVGDSNAFAGLQTWFMQ